MIFSLKFFFNDMGANCGLVQQNGRGYDIMEYVLLLITLMFQLGCEETEAFFRWEILQAILETLFKGCL